jgi:hypothetical protein
MKSIWTPLTKDEIYNDFVAKKELLLNDILEKKLEHQIVKMPTLCKGQIYIVTFDKLTNKFTDIEFNNIHINL